MGQIDYTWKDLTQMIPVNHRYRSVRQRMQPMLGALELEDGPMLWMMVLQICDGLSEAKLLSQLPENFCMRWFCGYGLADEIIRAADYAAYKRSIGAYQLVRLVKAVFQPEMTGEVFLSALNLILDDASGREMNIDGRRPYYVLVSEKSERLVELVESRAELELAYVRSDGWTQSLVVFGSEESVRDMLSLLPQLAVGVAKGCDWTKTQARAQSALQDQLVNGRTGSLFAGEHDKFRIVNLMLADKRLALENFLKESRLEQAYSLFEDMIARIKKRASEIHWLQQRHELLKIFCALYNGGFHYQHSEQFYITYERGIDVLIHGSFTESVEMMRSVLQSFELQQFEEVIAVGSSDYAAAAKEMIEKYYSTEITLGDMARHFGITPEYLSSSFRKSVGRNFVEYLTDVRIEHACRLLTFSGVKVNEVAHMVGFANADYFGRVFKQRMHITPRQYQKGKA